MKHHRLVNLISVVCIISFVLPYLLIAKPGNSNNQLYLIEKGPIKKSTLYTDGSVIELQTETVTLPIIGSDMTNINLDEFRRMVLTGRQAFERNPNKKIISADGPRDGLNIVFSVTNSPGWYADTALEEAARYIESVFDDPITVTINMNFADLPSGVLGWTSVFYAGYVTWTNTRTGLVSDMDANDTIQNYLPSGSTIPVRYNGSSGTVTNETRCRFSRANYNATIGTQAGTAASIEYNTDYNSLWDWDPSNGVDGSHLCFQSVVIHEIGHALGFTSRAEEWYDPNSDIDALDIYRFQRTDGSGDYNPDNLSEFQTTARLVDYNNPNDDHNSDVISAEYRMEDGNPNQASHFRTSVAALMDPNLGYGETFYPDFYKTPDITMFDATGWDYTPGITYTLTVNTVGNGSVTKNPDLSAYPSGTPVELTANPDPGWSFDHWSDALSGSDNPDTVIMDANKTVTAHFTQNQYTLTVNVIGNGTVTKNPDQATYTYGQQVELLAEPDQGWAFDHWSGSLTGSANPDTIIIDGNETVTAHFVEGQYTLTIYSNGSGSVTTNPDLPNYPYGTDVELLAEANPGWTFDHWEDSLTGSNNPDTITMNSDKRVTACFTQDHYTLTINIQGNGSVVADPDWATYIYGTEVELLAVADPGWIFDHWSGGLSGSDNPDTIVVNSDTSVTAHFEEEQYVEEGNSTNILVPFLEIFPNPARHRLVITYGIGQSAKTAELKIYDVTGQLVKDFSNLTPYAQCPTLLVWDGKDNTGRKVASGIYLLKFTVNSVGNVEDYKEMKKILLLLR